MLEGISNRRPLRVLTCLLFFASSKASFAAPAEPCRVGFDYSASTAAARPGEVFSMSGNWGPRRPDVSPELVRNGEMTGGYGRLEIVEWGEETVRVRIPSDVLPGVYGLSIFCGERLEHVSPFKRFEVLQPRPGFEYSLSSTSVPVGETLTLRGPFGPRGDREPMLVVGSNRPSKVPLEVLSWTDDVVRVRIPRYLDGEGELASAGPTPAQIYVWSSEPLLMAGYLDLEILPPTQETLDLEREARRAPWLRDSPKNVAVVAAVAFVVGALFLGLRAASAAFADWVLAGAFLVTWIWPFTFGERAVTDLFVLVLMEFIVIHSAAVMGALALAPPFPKRILAVVALALLYSLMAGGYSLISRSLWPLTFFWTLMATKFLPMFLRRDKDYRRDEIIARAAISTVIYVVVVAASLLVPVPELGVDGEVLALQTLGESGAWVESPERVLFAGFVYFALLGAYEVALSRHVDAKSTETAVQAAP